MCHTMNLMEYLTQTDHRNYFDCRERWLHNKKK